MVSDGLKPLTPGDSLGQEDRRREELDAANTLANDDALHHTANQPEARPTSSGAAEIQETNTTAVAKWTLSAGALGQASVEGNRNSADGWAGKVSYRSPSMNSIADVLAEKRHSSTNGDYN